MKKTLPFKVSARAARLIGRENVSEAEGAVAELVKNTYDADASFCIVAFLPRYTEPPHLLEAAEFDEARKKIRNLGAHYKIENGTNMYRLKQYLNSEDAGILTSTIMNLWIIDDGDGMPAEIIESDWMVIGTDSKLKDPRSRKGRYKSGAKGIGRFALDRLGHSSTMFSTFERKRDQMESLQWDVNWDDFEGEGKTLNDVKASVRTIDTNIKHETAKLNLPSELSTYLGKARSGTAINIKSMRDTWTQYKVARLEEFLSALIPPKEQRGFDVFLVDCRNQNPVNQVVRDDDGDFDYKINAKINYGGNVVIEVWRDEIHYNKLPREVFDFDEMKEDQFKKSSLVKKPYIIKTTLNNLLPGREDNFEVGSFNVAISFYKQNKSSKAERFFYKAKQYDFRKQWLKNHGGIKIYRDNFLVRPYGVSGGAYDWLQLGLRKTRNPAAASRKGWRVDPNNISGTIFISREANPSLIDKSNREGIIENEAFDQFKAIIIAVIQAFEDDRSTILSNIERYRKQKDQSPEDRDKSPAIAKKILEQKKEADFEEQATLARGFNFQTKEVGELKDDVRDLEREQITMRAMATLGTILISFAHEMGEMKAELNRKRKTFESCVNHLIKKDLISRKDLESIDSAYNPYVIMADWEKQDTSAIGWFEFALRTIKGSNQSRTDVDIVHSINASKHLWERILSEKNITLSFENKISRKPLVRAHQIDVHCIIHNLILNSIEAFDGQGGAIENKEIRILTNDVGNGKFLIGYSDNGPGLSKDIVDPMDIFKFSLSTKDGKRKLNNQITTGLGMWIVGNAVSDIGGEINLNSRRPNSGFSMDIEIPHA